MSSSPTAIVSEAIRTPLAKGRPTGALAGWHPVDLLAHVFARLVERTGIDPAVVDDVIVGCVSQAGEQTLNVARNAWLAAGLPDSVPATTVDRQCGSSQQALHFAAQGVLAGQYDVVVAAGVESMSRVPLWSSTMGQDPFGPRLTARYAPGLVPQGISAELIAAKWGLSRRDVDEFAVASQQRAAAASAAGRFAREIVPLPVAGEDGTPVLLRRDEGIRPGTTMEAIAGLEPAFRDEAAEARFGELPWVVTAANASQISDGAAAVLVVSDEAARALDLPRRARFHAFALAAGDPLLMLTSIIPATERVLRRGDLALDDIDLFEVNEAFASVVLAWQRETGADLGRVNVNGGAIALGHPLGASGARLATTLLHALEERGGRYGLQVMCEGGGMANATILERLD